MLSVWNGILKIWSNKLQLIRENQLTGFYIRATLAFNDLSQLLLQQVQHGFCQELRNFMALSNRFYLRISDVIGLIISGY